MKIRIICIGNPSLAGDAFGPLVGDKLLDKIKEANFEQYVKVVGNTSDPVNASNYLQVISPAEAFDRVIAVDAAIGPNVGSFKFGRGALSPGLGLDKFYPPVGDIYYKYCSAATPVEFIYRDNIEGVRSAAVLAANRIFNYCRNLISLSHSAQL